MKSISKKYFFGFLISIGLLMVLAWPVYSSVAPFNVPFVVIDFRFTPAAPPPKPVILLLLNNSDLGRLEVSQRELVSLSWQVSNATSCVASSNPPQSYWGGSANSVVNPASSPTGSYQPVNTQTIGSFDYTLTCNNTDSAGLSSTNLYTTRLVVTPALKPYIQTTGGDVHTNESINIPR